MQKKCLLPCNRNSFLPQVIKAVEFARFFLKNMDHNIPHIQEDPPPIGFIDGRDLRGCCVRKPEALRTTSPVETLFKFDLNAQLMQALINAVSDSFNMTGTRRSAEHEIVTKIGYRAHIEDNDFLRFFISAEMSSLFGKC
jgi:hypothetical protein